MTLTKWLRFKGFCSSVVQLCPTTLGKSSSRLCRQGYEVPTDRPAISKSSVNKSGDRSSPEGPRLLSCPSSSRIIFLGRWVHRTIRVSFDAPTLVLHHACGLLEIICAISKRWERTIRSLRIVLCVTVVPAAFGSSCNSFLLSPLFIISLWNLVWFTCPGTISCGSINSPPAYYLISCTDRDVYGLRYGSVEAFLFKWCLIMLSQSTSP